MVEHGRDNWDTPNVPTPLNETATLDETAAQNPDIPPPRPSGSPSPGGIVHSRMALSRFRTMASFNPWLKPMHRPGCSAPPPPVPSAAQPPRLQRCRASTSTHLVEMAGSSRRVKQILLPPNAIASALQYHHLWRSAHTGDACAAAAAALCWR